MYARCIASRVEIEMSVRSGRTVKNQRANVGGWFGVSISGCKFESHIAGVGNCE